MNLLASLFTLAALAAVWSGTLRIPVLRGTTLVPAHRWLLGGLGLWTVAAAESLLPNGLPAGWRDQLWYSTAVVMLCPLVAVLGARRPGASAWAAFVLAPLVVVMEWPALAQWRASGPPDRLVLELPTVLGFALVVTMGCGNYFGTRFTTGGTLYAAALLAIVVPKWFRSEPPADATSPFAAETFWATAALLAAFLSARRAERLHRAALSNAPGWDRVWLDFRDVFGIVWAKRVMDRINEAAHDERWPFRLGLAGFEPAPETANPLDPTAAEPRREHWMRFVLKRFVDPPWIDARLNTFETQRRGDR